MQDGYSTHSNAHIKNHASVLSVPKSDLTFTFLLAYALHATKFNI